MSKVTVRFKGTLRVEGLDRDRVTPDDVKAIVERKVLEALEPEGDVTLSAEASDG